MANTLLNIRNRVREAVGDGHRTAVTTALTTTKNVVSTNLLNFDGASDDKFPDWFIYVEDFTNAGASRVVSTYTASSGTCLVFAGANFTSDTADLATFMITKYNPDLYKQAIQRAIRRLDLTFWVPLNDLTLVTGNILPNSHFEDWAVSTVPDLYTLSNCTASETATAGLYRGPRGTSSALITATSGSAYMYITSNDYPRLLDAMGQDGTLEAWVYPSTADDAWLQIYTIKADGTEQTLPSAQEDSCPASKWSLVGPEDQTLNEDLVEIQIRFRVDTSGQTCYFDNARFFGFNIRELFLPKDFVDGHLSTVHFQTSHWADNPCDDLHLRTKDKVYNWDIVEDGTYKWLRLPALYPNERLLHLEGYTPLTVPTTDSASVEVNDPELELLIAQSALELYKMMRSPISTKDTSKFDREIAYWEGEVFRLTSRFRQVRPTETVRFRK